MIYHSFFYPCGMFRMKPNITCYNKIARLYAGVIHPTGPFARNTHRHLNYYDFRRLQSLRNEAEE